MKKLIGIFLSILMIALFTSEAFAVAGSCTQTTTESFSTGVRKIYFICTGDSTNGSIPNQALSSANAAWIQGWRLEQVTAYPTSGGTAPDAADVFILDSNGMDLLGCIDGSTTAYGGLNLIHATLTRATAPHLYVVGTGLHAYYYPFIFGTLTLKVTNQSTNSANYTIALTFYK